MKIQQTRTTLTLKLQSRIQRTRNTHNKRRPTIFTNNTNTATRERAHAPSLHRDESSFPRTRGPISRMHARHPARHPRLRNNYKPDMVSPKRSNGVARPVPSRLQTTTEYLYCVRYFITACLGLGEVARKGGPRIMSGRDDATINQCLPGDESIGQFLRSPYEDVALENSSNSANRYWRVRGR